MAVWRTDPFSPQSYALHQGFGALLSCTPEYVSTPRCLCLGVALALLSAPFLVY